VEESVIAAIPRILGPLALTALIAPLASCRSVEGTRGLPPLFEIYSTPALETTEARSEIYLRPLGSYEDLSGEKGEPDAWRVFLLKPFGKFRSSNRRGLSQILPLWQYRRTRLLDGGEDIDWMLFPFLFGGADPDEGAYFAVFPLGGRLKGLIGHQFIDFALFPLWARLEQKERVSYNVLWPIFNITSGGGWSGWRFFPFYSEYEWLQADGSPRSRRRAILWPFWIVNDTWHEGKKTHVFFSMPFYGVRENERSVTRTYAWPLYVEYYDKLRDAKLVGGYFFPYRFGEYQGRRYFDPWPFFGIKEVEEVRLETTEYRRFREFAIWPIQRYDWSRDIREESERFWLLPFYWNHLTVNLIDGTSQRKWKAWPFVGYERDDDELMIETFSPMWMHRRDWDRTYGRLFAWFRYRQNSRYTGWELFWGTFYWGSGTPETPPRKVEDEPATETNGETRSDDFLFSILGGLFECGEHEDKLILRVLWIPWW
jgi:hypothetical protein